MELRSKITIKHISLTCSDNTLRVYNQAYKYLKDLCNIELKS